MRNGLKELSDTVIDNKKKISNFVNDLKNN